MCPPPPRIMFLLHINGFSGSGSCLLFLPNFLLAASCSSFLWFMCILDLLSVSCVHLICPALAFYLFYFKFHFLRALHFCVQCFLILLLCFISCSHVCYYLFLLPCSVFSHVLVQFSCSLTCPLLLVLLSTPVTCSVLLRALFLVLLSTPILVQIPVSLFSYLLFS